jgi:hypothetical protein
VHAGEKAGGDSAPGDQDWTRTATSAGLLALWAAFVGETSVCLMTAHPGRQNRCLQRPSLPTVRSLLHCMYISATCCKSTLCMQGMLSYLLRIRRRFGTNSSWRSWLESTPALLSMLALFSSTSSTSWVSTVQHHVCVACSFSNSAWVHAFISLCRGVSGLVCGNAAACCKEPQQCEHGHTCLVSNALR